MNSGGGRKRAGRGDAGLRERRKSDYRGFLKISKRKSLKDSPKRPVNKSKSLRTSDWSGGVTGTQGDRDMGTRVEQNRRGLHTLIAPIERREEKLRTDGRRKGRWEKK